MNYSSIPDLEKKFHSTLTDSEVKVFTLVDTVLLNSSPKVELKKIKCGYDSFYHKEITKKDMIVLHGTIGTLKGDIASLTKKDSGMITENDKER